MPTAFVGIPTGRTPVADLSPPGFQHHQLVKIDQDFHPNSDYEIALDGWTSSSGLAEVRMWWMDTGDGDVRSPFGKGVTRHIAIRYDRQASGDWKVKIERGRRDFIFDVELSEDNTPQVFADIELGDTIVRHCQVLSGKLVSRKILGIPAGLRRMDVICVDSDGQVRSGSLVRH